MKKGIHPENYRPVVFKDMSNGDCFLSRSTCATKETIEFEGQTYPVIKIEISNTSHPFFTGKSKLRKEPRWQVIVKIPIKRKPMHLHRLSFYLRLNFLPFQVYLIGVGLNQLRYLSAS